jgi:flagellar basal-body rod modification protein FlgD
MASVSGLGTTAQEQSINYLNILIAQMRNQDPMDPMDNNQMASQLAQLSQLQQLENLNGTFQSVLTATEAKYAASLLGKTVSFVPEGGETEQSGPVTGVEIADGQACVRVGSSLVPVDEILSISESGQ